MIKKISIAIIILVLVAFALSIYTVQQGQSALVLKLGQIELNAAGQPQVMGPGLHFKWPLIDTVSRFDMRLRNLDIDASRVMTSEQKDVLVTAYVKWQIQDMAQYYKATGGDAFQAQQLLQQKVNDELRSEFGQYTITQLLTDQDRAALMSAILSGAVTAAQPLGVKVIDVRIVQIDLPNEVADKIYARMSSARENSAATLIATGKERAEAIRSTADATVTITMAEAQNKAAEIKAQGDAAAAVVYGKAYQQNPEFYEFYRSLQAYQTALGGGQQVLVLQPTGTFFKYFNPTVSS